MGCCSSSAWAAPASSPGFDVRLVVQGPGFEQQLLSTPSRQDTAPAHHTQTFISLSRPCPSQTGIRNRLRGGDLLSCCQKWDDRAGLWEAASDTGVRSGRRFSPHTKLVTRGHRGGGGQLRGQEPCPESQGGLGAAAAWGPGGVGSPPLWRCLDAFLGRGISSQHSLCDSVPRSPSWEQGPSSTPGSRSSIRRRSGENGPW